jgi:hypothetical protein
MEQIRSYRPHAALATALALVCSSAAGTGQQPAPVPMARFELLANGDFRESIAGRPAWWLVEGAILESGDLTPSLRTPPGAWAQQPMAAFAPTLGSFVLEGWLQGSGRLLLRDGGGGEWVLDLPAPSGESAGQPRRFRIDGQELIGHLGRPLQPRLELILSGRGSAEARWSALTCLCDLPSPSAAQLRVEALACLAHALGPWLERGTDRVGPLTTGFFAQGFDVIDGRALQSFPAGLHPLLGWLLRLEAVQPEPQWSLALDQGIEALLGLGLDPSSGLPRLWDPVADQPLVDQSIEVAAYLRFLIDAAETGPARWREPCRAAAARLVETILTQGVLPDGQLAAAYLPRDGTPNTDLQPLRRLDVAAQVCRWSAAEGDARGLLVARNAVAALLYTHHWPGTAEAIDPGFDDDFGHYGARAVVMHAAFPEEPIFIELLNSGIDKYLPLWRQAVSGGGSIAADQVRCWGLLRDHARRTDQLRAPLSEALSAAIHGHWQGEQLHGGPWTDVTFYRFGPRLDLQVGDVPGLPANLLQGLALAQDPLLGLPAEPLRARFAAVLRTTDERFRRPFGYLPGLFESQGGNSAQGSLRLLPALITLLEVLPK